MRKNIIYLILLFFFCFSCSANVAYERKSVSVLDSIFPVELKVKVDSLINNSIEKSIIPGAVVSIVVDSQIVYLQSYGNRSIFPDTQPMHTYTMFDIASLTKVVSTTPSIMKLIENKKINLDDNVKKYIPDFKPWIQQNDTIDITIKHLLTHSSGLSSYVNVNKCLNLFEENYLSLTDYIATEVPRNFRPGSKFLYSCLNFVILQEIVEKVTGQSLDEYVTDSIFAPLGMKHSVYVPNRDSLRVKEWEIAPTILQKDKCLIGDVQDPLARLLKDGISGNAGLFSTAEDLSKYCISLMCHDSVKSKVLSSETIDLMSSIPSEIDTSVGRSLGWDVRSTHSSLMGNYFSKHRSICHTGYTGTSIVIDLDCRIAVILLTNRVHLSDKGSLKEVRKELSNIIGEFFCGDIKM